MSFYAVKVGRVPGIYSTWDECKEQVHKFPGAIYGKFKTQAEAEAFIQSEPARVTPVMKVVSAVVPTSKVTPPTTVISKVTAEIPTIPDPSLQSIPVLPESEAKSHGYEIWTDGSVELNQSASYAYIIQKDGKTIAQGGSKITEPPYTAPRAELLGVIEGVRALYKYVRQQREREMLRETSTSHVIDKLPDFTLYCDNSFVMNTINDWGPKRKTAKDWEGYAYADKFINLLTFIKQWREQAQATFEWIRGHSGIKMNEEVDQLAKQYRLS